MRMIGEAELYKRILDRLHDGVFFVDRDRNITYWNLGAEELTGFKSSKVMGKYANNILIPVSKTGVKLSEKNCPLMATITSGQEQETEFYIRHDDGYRVPVESQTIPIMDTAGEIIGAAQLFRDAHEKVSTSQRIEELEQSTLIDGLTGVGNQRYVEINLNAKMDQLERYGWPFGILNIDLDNYEKINESYGQDIGDELLKVIATTLLKGTRASDVLGRWEGDKFIAILTNINQNQLFTIANRFRFLVEYSSISRRDERIARHLLAGTGIQLIQATASIGACLAKPGQSIGALLKISEHNLLQSQKAGGNHVTITDE